MEAIGFFAALGIGFIVGRYVVRRMRKIRLTPDVDQYEVFKALYENALEMGRVAKEAATFYKGLMEGQKKNDWKTARLERLALKQKGPDKIDLLIEAEQL